MNVSRFKQFNIEVADSESIILTNIPDVFSAGHKFQSLDNVPANIIDAIKANNKQVLLCFSADWILQAEIEKCERLSIRYRGVGMMANTQLGIPRPYGYCVPFLFKEKRFFEIVMKTFEILQANSAASHFDIGDFGNIYQCLVMTKNLPGSICEFGVYKGSSSLFILQALLNLNDTREYYGYDTFEGFNYEEAKVSRDALWQGSHGDTSYESVQGLLSTCGQKFNLFKANIFGMKPDELPDSSSVANIDVDMAEAIVAAANLVLPKMCDGGIIIFEDYGHTPELGGAQLAIDRWTEEHNFHRKLYLDSGQLLVFPTVC